MSFLVAQKVLRDAECARSGKQDLSSVQLMKVSLEVASVVSVISAPFDMANTLKQSRELGLTYLFSGNVLQKMFRGWSLSASSLIIHNIASITLIDYLERLRSD